MSRLHSTSRAANASSFVVVTALTAALVSTALCGCGSMPTAPTANALTAPAPGAASVAGAPTRMPADPGEGGGNGGSGASGGSSSSPPATGVATSVLTGFTGGRASGKSVTSQSVDVTAAGGTLTNGRWTLTVPAGALAAPAHFTLSVPGSRGPACQVQVTPADAAVLAPLTLSVDCHGVPAKRIGNFVILGYDATNATWTPVDGGAGGGKHAVSVTITSPGVFGAGYPDGTPGW